MESVKAHSLVDSRISAFGEYNGLQLIMIASVYGQFKFKMNWDFKG